MIKSAVATTAEIDDIYTAAAELSASVLRDVTLLAHSVGILYYDYEVEGDLLARHLQETLSMPIVGCSAIALLDGKTGYREMSAMLSVLTSDDGVFRAAVREPLDPERAGDRLAAAYGAARGRLAEDPKLIFALPPLNPDIVFDRYLDALTDTAHGAPIVGGIPSNNGGFKNAILFDGAFHSHSAVLVLMSGAIKPLFSLASVLSPISGRRGVVTRANDTVLYEVDGAPFVNFLEGYGLRVQGLTGQAATTFFHKYPVLIEGADDAGRADLPYVRIINRVEPDGKTAVLHGCVPIGATVSLAVLQRQDLDESLRRALLDILAQIDEANSRGGQYSTIICMSCGARHLIMNPQFDMEGKIIREMLPPGLTLFGFYSFGELCPVATEAGNARNRLHNASIVFCAI